MYTVHHWIDDQVWSPKVTQAAHALATRRETLGLTTFNVGQWRAWARRQLAAFSAPSLSR